MKYEFHVGDYVESKGGLTGFISSVGETGCCVTWNTSIAKVNIDYDFEELIKDLARLGQYDFTEPEQPKEITKLNPGWRGDEAYRKINELVDAVNELRKDKNE